MSQIFRVLWDAIRAFWEELLFLALMNLVTVLLMLPVVTFPPALAALCCVANLVAREKAIHWSDYFDGFRRYFLKSWALALLNILVLVIMATNIWFYTPDVAPFKLSPQASLALDALFATLGLLWILMQLYAFPLVLEQTDERLRTALRNALALIVINPGFSILLLIFLVLIAALSIAVPPLWVLLTFAFFAVVCNRAVIHLLQPFRDKMAAGQTGESASERVSE